MALRRTSGSAGSRRFDGALDADIEDKALRDADGGAGAADAAPAPRRSMSVGRSLEPEAGADVLMDFIIEKLRLLAYETDFCRRKKPFWPLLHRFYFVMAAPNPGEQFYYFTSLAAWLLSLCGRNFPPPQQFDDPNATCQNILMELRDLGFAPPSWPPARLRQGYGDPVCGLLDALASLALEKQQFVFRMPVQPPENYPEEAEDAEGMGAEVTDEMYVPPPDDEPYMEGAVDHKEEEEERAAPVEATVDPVQWKLELERLAPELRFGPGQVSDEAKGWRAHLETAKQLHQEISKALPDSVSQLQRLESDVASALEKLSTRERFINSHFEPLTGEYQVVRERLAEVQECCNKTMESVAEATNELSRLDDRLAQVKQTMESRGNDISDTSPLVKIKSAIQKLKAEICQMQVRTGVVEHTLLQMSLKKRDSSALQSQTYTPDAYEEVETF